MHSEVGVAAELVQTQSDHFSLTRFGQRQIETFEAISSQREKSKSDDDDEIFKSATI